MTNNLLHRIAQYIFLATLILVPIAFLPTPYISLAIVKTIVIAVGILASAVCYGISALKTKSIHLPTKKVFWTGALVAVSLIISSILSNHFGKSFFGQGFEIGTVIFLITLLLASWVTMETLRTSPRRIVSIMKILGIVYGILAILQIIRMIFGPTAISLAILSNLTSSIFGGWYDFGTLSLIIFIITISAILFLPSVRKMKIIFGVFALISILMAFIVDQTTSWTGLAFVFAVITIIQYRHKGHGQTDSKIKSFFKRISWLPAIICVLAIVMIWKGDTIAKPVIVATNTGYSELSLPWQMTTDVIAGTVKNYPLFGVGPNHFAEAYTVFKPVGINTTDAWNIEFNSAFGLIPTFIVTQGIIGGIVWILFFIMIAMLIIRVIKRLPEEPKTKFIAISSSATLILLLLNMIWYVPSHAILFLTFIFLGIVIWIATEAGAVNHYKIEANTKSGKRVFSIILIVAIILAILGGLIYIKKFIAFSYFASGVKSINIGQNYESSESAFRKALSLDKSDMYLQALSENDRLWANKLIQSATSTPGADVVAKISELINDGIKTARDAISYDPSNYYNFISEARISDLAASIKMDSAYENSVRSYTNAISLNTQNPSLYVSLAQSHAANAKYDDALKAIGSALQVKNNYIDAVYLLSQIQAAQGNLKDAIVSTQVATEMNPQSSLLFFQLGLLHYNNKDYSSAATALEKAIAITPDYANAKYFLGLSYVRLGRNTDAINIFTDLAKTNPENQEVSFILTNLQAGKSPFADAQPPVTSTPEKRATLPVKEKKK